jgi:hypothetical protein
MAGEGVGHGSAEVSRSTGRDVTWPNRKPGLRLQVASGIAGGFIGRTVRGRNVEVT